MKAEELKKTKKKYSKPEVTKVDLVPEQVVLANCYTKTNSNKALGQGCRWGGANPCLLFG